MGEGTVVVPAGMPAVWIVPGLPFAPVNVRSTRIGAVVWPGKPLTLAGVAVIAPSAACAEQTRNAAHKLRRRDIPYTSRIRVQDTIRAAGPARQSMNVRSTVLRREPPEKKIADDGHRFGRHVVSH